MEFKSQFEQDKHVIAKYDGKEGGYFVEVGAYDGFESSNTYILEKNYNWKGICVECNPRFAQNIPRVRNCHVSTHAIYNVNGETMEFYDAQ